jgi:hypothetical protein
VIIKDNNHGKEYILKLDGLEESSETSYGIGTYSYGFPLLARYEDSRYGAVCGSSSRLQTVICHQLNITGGFQDQAVYFKHFRY